MSEKVNCKIIGREWAAEDHYILSLEDNLSEASRPGQFAMISPKTPTEPFFKRPYSIFRRISEGRHGGKELQFLIKVVGKGSRQTSELPLGSEIEVVAPLGNSFDLECSEQLVVLVGGGIGMAPLFELAEHFTAKRKEVAVLLGARTCELLLVKGLYEEMGAEVLCSTDDGSEGMRGNVGQLLEHYLQARKGRKIKVYSCGPDIMMRGVAEIAAKFDLPCQLSLEAHMGCGFGVCLGCVIEDKNGDYRRVCKDGPVFDARKLY